MSINPLSNLTSALKDHNVTIAVAESCTGGMLSSFLTQEAGASQYFTCGFITYSNQAKQDCLGVSEAVLNQFGAVSQETAQAMTAGLLARCDTDFAIAITGIAGPASDDTNKPVGLVYIGVGSKESGIHIERCIFKGDRNSIQLQSCQKAAQLMLACL